MRYVDRDPVTKEVIGHYACEQRRKQERLPDDHPDILAFIAKREAMQDQTRDRIRVLNELVDAKIALDAQSKGV